MTARVLRIPTVADFLHLFTPKRHPRAAEHPEVPETPLNLQLFSLDQLARHAEALAPRHKVSTERHRDALLARLADNERVLLETHSRLSAALTAKERVSPAGEWLLDNFHLIEEQIRTAKRHLPAGYSRQLPHLATGASAGLPRVYDIALEIIAHVDGRVDDENVSVFVSAYQSRTPLALGELWAIPIMLRLALLENLRRVATRVVVGMNHRMLARDWAQRIQQTAENDAKNLIVVAADMARSTPPLTNSFVAELAQRLQDKGTIADIPLAWVEQQLESEGSSVEQRVQSESQQQAANQVSVGASISSLRFLNAADWRIFVESMSVVEAELRKDPAATYAAMDFATRDSYRHAVERLARKARRPEQDVAAAAVGLALDASRKPGVSKRETHVGRYLRDEGLDTLRQRLGLPDFARFGLSRRGVWSVLYFGMIALVTLTVPLAVLGALPSSPAWMRAVIGILCLIAASQLGVSVANWFATSLKRPTTLPRLDLANGIPDELRTLVVVPSMLIAPGQVERLVENLEIRYLGNRDHNLVFALLTDFADADQETTPDDELLVQTAVDGIARLIARHGEGRFCLFHRPREWNSHEGKWMGRERKRGKLEALNAFLRGRAEGCFAVVAGDTSRLGTVRYVITLDTDTQLPRDAAIKLVGTMAHPLNRARFDAATGRIVEGYGLLQPRVGIALPNARRSWFVRLNAGEPGTDPYTRAVSDVYQDLFGEGSFVGKGIYDVDAFMQSLEPALPENLILSHDLIEGCFARSGLVSDVLLLEDYPSHVIEDIKRRRRWTRGDWQIAAWLLPRVPRRDGTWAKNPLSALSRWKIFDNLRRSITPAATLCLLLAGWGLFTDGWLFTRLALLLAFTVAAFATLSGFLRKPQYAGALAHLRFEAAAGAERFAQAFLGIAFLPNDAASSLDAIGRSLYRMLVSKRRLLEWRSATDPRNAEGWGLTAFARSMAAGPVIGLATLLFLAVDGGADAARPALGFVALWIASPLLARRLSAPQSAPRAQIDAEAQAYLRRLSRKTWSFFETFVSPAENWLPPDNFQEHPSPVIAHRTSPTNIGMSLLANLAAFDFGFIPTETLLARTRATFTTLGKMERFRGHFFNWYDTLTLQPLPPRYVSTVDSGNMSGHLLVLESGLGELADAPIVSPNVWSGIADAVSLLREAGRTSAVAPRGEIDAACGRLTAHLAKAPQSPAAAKSAAQTVVAELEALADSLDTSPGAVTYWINAAIRQARDGILAPLAKLLPAELANGKMPTLRELSATSAAACALIDEAAALARMAAEFAVVEYGFLYDETRHLLTIGYNVGDHRRDAAHYDLLASEARLVSFVAIAEGDLPQDHWFALGRLLTSFGAESTLLSWSGSMFEYLMPLLVMPTFDGTLLEHTYHTVVQRQIEYGAQSAIPWGISESGYNTTDAQFNYQYKAFGVPGLGFKRGLADDLVIAPYATAMALMVDPAAATANLLRMRGFGFEGPYGFYEAVDYTPARLPAGQSHAIVRSFMAHHQGMSLLAFAYLLLDKPMQRRFCSRPSFLAAEPLLHERLPKVAAYYPHAREVSEGPQLIRDTEAAMRVVTTPHTPSPEVHLLSNGRYAAMITNSGGGYSRWGQYALTRWREDPTTDAWGSFLYVRDVNSKETWSAAYQPMRRKAARYEAIFPQARAEFRRRDDGIDIHTEIAVSPEDDIELRRFTLTNVSGKTRVLELTTYAEVVLAPQAADEAHPAFSNLFVQTETLPEKGAILCTRRPRSDREETPVLLHLLSVHGAAEGKVSFETDRKTFLGRERTTARPVVMDPDAPEDLSGSQGSVLDPIVAIRVRVRIEPEQSATLHAVLGVGKTREAALALMEKYRDRHLADRVFELAWTHRQVVMRQLQTSEREAQIYMRLAGHLLFANAALRPKATVLAKNRRGQSSLWGYGISGDLPIVVLRMSSAEHLEIATEMIRAHSFWRELGLASDLVIWNEDDSGYRQDLQDRLLSAVHAGHASHLLDMRGGIFIRRIEQMGEDDRVLMLTTARAVLVDTAGTLAEQVERRLRQPAPMPALVPSALADTTPPPARLPGVSLAFDNGIGGFTPDGREYVVRLPASVTTPLPWVNVLANPYFGTVVSESGGAYTWCENSHEYRVTPWSNDALTDMTGEAFYIRDDETGRFWSPSPFPTRGSGDYETRHGFGYSRFKHEEAGIASELTTFVAADAPIKLTVIKLTNRTQRPRTISLTGYAEWTLGELRGKSMMHIVTEIDPTNGAVCARNPYHAEFGARIGFFDVSETVRTVTADRGEFLGRNGQVGDPAALRAQRLSGRVGTALDPCAAIQTPLILAPGEERSVTFSLGVGRDVDDTRTLIRRFGRTPAALAALGETEAQWRHILEAVQVSTPEPEVDVLVNGWLPYQVIACRLWARTGFYQSGGAFGFRDQLQDAMALLHTYPRLLREQILRCAGRQYVEGDVQHWWHPPSGFGVRTHFSDDFLWLPLATSRYVLGIGDTGVLDVRVPFIEGRQVKPDEEAYGDQPRRADESGTIYEHCVRAIQHSLRFGAHGLPLMGCGDWNDGMNLVGEHGRGESVWLGFFLYAVLVDFAKVARLHGDAPFAETCEREAEQLKGRVEANAWDGEWYRRAYFDDGAPLGSQLNTECQIDALPQSWAVLSGAGDSARARQSMAAVDRRLVDREKGIIKLFDPPFDKAQPNPGYIRGYVPGVRENGGQYTHAAVWTTMAFAGLGEVERAWELARMINPVNHGATEKDLATYLTEPYVVAADVYAVSPHTGRGGWSWYTGAAGWMFRLYVESLLGITLKVDQLHFAPKVPAHWDGFEVRYRYRNTPYRIRLKRGNGEPVEVRLDGGEARPYLMLADDTHEHNVHVRF